MKKNGEAVEIRATRKKDERLEGDFYKPSKKESSFFGEKSYPIEFRNKTGIVMTFTYLIYWYVHQGGRVEIFTGRKYNFTVLALDQAQDDVKGTTLELRPSSDGMYRVGLVTSSQYDTEVHTVDLYKLVERVKLVEILETEGVYRVTVTLANEMRHELKKDKTKIFRESDKNYWRNVAHRGDIRG